MPVSKEKQKLYPGGSLRSPEWLKLRDEVRQRAGNRCERCGVENHRLIYRSKDGHSWRYAAGEDWNVVYDADPLPDDDLPSPVKESAEIKFHITWRSKQVKVICTTAHVDGGLSDHSLRNLAFWCQRCHNLEDAPQRAKNAAETRRKRKGQPDLFKDLP